MNALHPARLHTFALTAAISLFTSACRSEDAGSTLSAVRDSAGVEIVENSGPLWQPGEEWRLSEEPTLNIGSESARPDYEFGFAHNPFRLQDGRVVVADMQTNRMQFYDAAGTYLASAGKTGDGPGEFTQLYRLHRIAGDSLMALNPISLTSIFTPAGEYVRRFTLDVVPSRTNVWWIGPLSNGTLLGVSLQREGTVQLAPPANPEPGTEYATFRLPEQPPTYRDTLQHFLFTMEGRLIDSIGKLPGQWIGARTIPFRPEAAYAFHGTTFYHSPGDVVEIRVFRSLYGESGGGTAGVDDGGSAGTWGMGPNAGASRVVRLERIIRQPPPSDNTVTEAVKQQYFDAEWARAEEMNKHTDYDQTIGLERRLAEAEFPPAKPAHGNRMIADALGNLWLQDYLVDPVEPFRYTVIDPEGRWLGTVTVPRALTISEIGEDYVLGIYTGDLGVQYVRQYTLEKGR